MLSKEAILAYPDFLKPFDLYTDASDVQLGATLVQEGKPIGFYTRKLNGAQINYTVGEKELLGIVEGFKAFEGILQGTHVTVHTDHLNLLYKNLPSQRMVQWQLLLEEFHPTFKHVAGADNDAADALSRLEMTTKQTDTIDWEPKRPRLTYKKDGLNKSLCKNFVAMQFDKDMFESDERLLTMSDAAKFIDNKYMDCKFPLDVRMFEKHQQKDEKMQRQAQKAIKNGSNVINQKEVEGVTLIHQTNLILVPEIVKERMVTWYHKTSPSRDTPYGTKY